MPQRNVINASVSPKGSLETLSQREVQQLSEVGTGSLYTLFRQCALAILNTGAHVDNALMGRGAQRLRTDLSFTLFLTPVAYLFIARFSKPKAEEEARLAVISCAPLVSTRTEQLLVVDIGAVGADELRVSCGAAP